MLEPPDLPEGLLLACLRDSFGLDPATVQFLPLGADLRTAVFRAEAAGGATYFVKLRRGDFDEVAVTLPGWLHERGVGHIIPPLPARDGRLWAQLEPFTVIACPFIAGDDGYARPLSPGHWRALGQALSALHTAQPPAQILGRIPVERYDDAGRRAVERFVGRPGAMPSIDVAAAQMAAALSARRDEVLGIVARADELAQSLQARGRELVVCHADIHAANVIIAGDQLYIVDWDTLVRAPKERDLMFIGGAQGFAGCTPQEEEELFYAGYGPAQIDREALAYYRYERVVQDIMVFCGQIFLTAEGGADRAQAVRWLMSNFAPGGTIDRARAADASA